MKKTLLFIAIGFFSLNEMNAQIAKEQGPKTLQTIVINSDYTLKTQTATNNSFTYSVVKNNSVVFNSAQSNVLPNVFSTEKEAIEAGKNKAAELEKNIKK